MSEDVPRIWSEQLDVGARQFSSKEKHMGIVIDPYEYDRQGTCGAIEGADCRICKIHRHDVLAYGQEYRSRHCAQPHVFPTQPFIGKEFELEVLDNKPATESTTKHEMADTISRAIKQHAPDAHLVPFLVPGVTDACYLRPKGMVVYGFTPLPPQEDLDLIHGHNERVSLEGLEFSLRVGLDAIMSFIT